MIDSGAAGNLLTRTIAVAVGGDRLDRDRGRRARLLIMLRSRPSHEVVLELLESEPGRIDYRLDGFDIPAVRRTVNGYALRCHDPVP